MKKKSDFITNSSSCSFVVWGIDIDLDELKEKCGRHLFQMRLKEEAEKKDKKAKEQGAFITVPSKLDNEELEKEYQEFIESSDFPWDFEYYVKDLDISTMPYEVDVMIGKSPFSMKAGQTLDEFKQEICDAFNKVGFDLEPKDLSQIERCWMDG